MKPQFSRREGTLKRLLKERHKDLLDNGFDQVDRDGKFGLDRRDTIARHRSRRLAGQRWGRSRTPHEKRRKRGGDTVKVESH